MVLDILGKFVPTGLFQSSTYNSVVNAGLFLIYILVYAIIFIGPILAYYVYYVKYNYNVEIFKRTASGHPTAYDRGRIKKDKDGNRYFVFFWRRKIRLPVADIKYERVTTRGRPLLFFEQISATEFVPCDVKVGNPSVNIMPIEEDLKHWYTLTIRRIESSYNQVTFWQKYGVVISVLGISVIFLLGLWLITSKSEAIVRMAETIGSSMQVHGEKILEAAKEVGKQSLAGRP